MDVRVNHAGQQRGVAQVEHARAGRMRDGGSHGADAIAFNQDFAGLKDFAGVDFEQARGVEDNCPWWGLRSGLLRRLLCGGGDGGEGAKRKAEREFQQGSHVHRLCRKLARLSRVACRRGTRIGGVAALMAALEDGKIRAKLA